jgi:hypothetical protein
VFKSRVLRRISGPKTEELTDGWRKLRNEELHNVCSSILLEQTNQGDGQETQNMQNREIHTKFDRKI